MTVLDVFEEGRVVVEEVDDEECDDFSKSFKEPLNFWRSWAKAQETLPETPRAERR